VRAILDSGPLIALWRNAEQHKSWAEAVFTEFTGPFYVTEFILCEVSHLTGRDRELLEGLKTGRFIIGATAEADQEILERCCRKFAHCDMADASIIAASERRPTLQVLTADRRHFLSYRRTDGSRLPLILPEA